MTETKKKMLIFCFDPLGKDMPYLKEAKMVTDFGKIKIGQLEIPYREAIWEDGVIRLEYYHDHDEEQPTAYDAFLARMRTLVKDYDKIATLGIDSVTMMEISARLREEKVLNPLPEGVDSKYEKGAAFDGRTWFGGSTDALEKSLIIRFAGLPMNVVINCHIHERQNMRNGEILRGPYAPGRLTSRNLLGSAFQEQYYFYTTRDKEGNQIRRLQTSNRDGWQATTQIDAPDPCHPSYEALWKNWKGSRLPIHAMVYGESGVGKSTLLSTFPKR